MTSAADLVVPASSVKKDGGTVYVSITTPTAPINGDVWFDLAANEWKRWDGASGTWIVVTGGAGGAGLPAATRNGQVLIATGAAAPFPWDAGDPDAGRF